MNLILALPATAGAASSALPPALSRLAAYASPKVDDRGLLHAILEALGAPDAAPAPLLALGAGLHMSAADACTMAASPILLAIHGDDVRVAGRATGLSADYAARAVALLNATFSADGIHFVAARSDAWFAQMPHTPDVIVDSVDTVIGQSLYACRPQGRDARLWERYGNEIQMLLFGLNDSTGLTGEMRGERDVPPPNALWLWGGGALLDSATWHGVRALAATADTSDAADLARGVTVASGREYEVPPATLAELAPASIGQAVLVVLPDKDGATLAAQWLLPALRALESGSLSRLTVVTGSVRTHLWSAGPPSWLARVRARLTSSRAMRLPVMDSAAEKLPERPAQTPAP
jgi:hypothetical protein